MSDLKQQAVDAIARLAQISNPLYARVMSEQPCSYFKRYKGIREPKCNCKPCFTKWCKEQLND